MKRILFTSWYGGLGGGETDLLALARSLDAGDYECHLLLPTDGQLSEIWRETVGPVHIIPFRGATTFFVPAVWARFPVVKRFAKLLQRERIDLAHSDYHSLPMIAPAAQLAGLPFMFTLWGWWFKPKSWQRLFFRDIPKTVARSIAIRDGYLGQPPFMPVENLPVVYPGVDTERFHPDLDGARLRDELGIARDAPLVAMVARFQPVKGHHTFQSVAEAIAGKYRRRVSSLRATMSSAWRPTGAIEIRFLGWRAPTTRCASACTTSVFETMSRMSTQPRT